MNEIEYRTIERFPGYRFGSDGSVWSNKLGGWERLAGYISNIGYRTHYVGLPSQQLCHRLICEAFHGQCPSKRHEVRHLDGCKLNNAATNLAWGTRSENQMDRVAHGTSNRGERQHEAKLDQRDVLAIVGRIEAGQSFGDIARDYGMESHAIGNINTGKTWRWLTNRESYPIRNCKSYSRGSKHNRAKLNELDASNIKRLLAIGFDQTAIARSFGVSRGAIQRIHIGKNWKHVSA